MSLVRVNMLDAAIGQVTDTSEVELVERAKSDPGAFALLYRGQYQSIASYVYRRTHDAHVTEDLVADVFLTALRTLPRYRYRGVPVRFWLLRIATNAVNRWARRRRRFVIVDSDKLAVAIAPEPSAHGAEERRAMRAMLSLAPRYQAVLALHHFEGLSVADVASILGCRVGTVKSRLSRAREALRKALS